MRKLEADIRPLQEANAELSEKSGMLQAEKRLLEEDVKRLKARTQVSINITLLYNECNKILSLNLTGGVVHHVKLIWLVVQQLLNQQKDSDQEESKKLHSERETHLKRIQQLTEETGKLKNEVARSVCSLIQS